MSPTDPFAWAEEMNTTVDAMLEGGHEFLRESPIILVCHAWRLVHDMRREGWMTQTDPDDFDVELMRRCREIADHLPDETLEGLWKGPVERSRKLAFKELVLDAAAFYLQQTTGREIPSQKEAS